MLTPQHTENQEQNAPVDGIERILGIDAAGHHDEHRPDDRKSGEIHHVKGPQQHHRQNGQYRQRRLLAPHCLCRGRRQIDDTLFLDKALNAFLRSLQQQGIGKLQLHIVTAGGDILILPVHRHQIDAIFTAQMQRTDGSAQKRGGRPDTGFQLQGLPGGHRLQILPGKILKLHLTVIPQTQNFTGIGFHHHPVASHQLHLLQGIPQGNLTADHINHRSLALVKG